MPSMEPNSKLHIITSYVIGCDSPQPAYLQMPRFRACPSSTSPYRCNRAYDVIGTVPGFATAGRAYPLGKSGAGCITPETFYHIFPFNAPVNEKSSRGLCETREPIYSDRRSGQSIPIYLFHTSTIIIHHPASIVNVFFWKSQKWDRYKLCPKTMIFFIVNWLP